MYATFAEITSQGQRSRSPETAALYHYVRESLSPGAGFRSSNSVNVSDVKYGLVTEQDWYKVGIRTIGRTAFRGIIAVHPDPKNLLGGFLEDLQLLEQLCAASGPGQLHFCCC
jgi:hypothetical protein